MVLQGDSFPCPLTLILYLESSKFLSVSKFKNWSLEGENVNLQRYHRHVEIYWSHDVRPVEVIVLREDAEVMHKTDAKEFGVLVAEVDGRNFEELEHESFDSLKAAKEWARGWMYDNPNLSEYYDPTDPENYLLK